MVRKAVIRDIKPIHKLLRFYGSRGLLLPRSLSELYDHIRDYWVFEADKKDASIIGVCGLGICWEDLSEIRSLAVREGYQGKKTGTLLVEACLNEARSFGVRKVFVLTYVPDFFSRLGFKEVDKSVLPHKVWADCLKCPKFPDCDETSMIMEL